MNRSLSLFIWMFFFRITGTSLTHPWIWARCQRPCMKAITKTQWSLPKTFASFSATLRRTRPTRSPRLRSCTALKKAVLCWWLQYLHLHLFSFSRRPDLCHDPQLVGLLWKEHHLHHLGLQVGHSEWAAHTTETQLQGQITKWRQLTAC